MAKHTVRDELVSVLVFVGFIWCVFFVCLVWPRLESYGIVPRTLRGLIGIPLAPFLHASLAHLVSNTIPLAVLLLLLAGSRANSWTIVVAIVLWTGVLLWLFGRPANHIGASGLIYGLAGFLVVSGVYERRLVPMIMAIVVVILYGGTLLFGIVPSWGSQVSWEGHLLGAVAGGSLAYWLTEDWKSAEKPIIPS
jgi:membrane associated rhomboid family serine protease